MNSAAVTYTPLECLLLFQTLVVYGAEEQDFERISSLLTNNALVKDADTYNAQRLSADALRTLYLRLLRDELRSEEDAQEDHTSRKRKLPTPPLPSIKDALEYKEKLPLLVNRLYARYREYMVRAIQEDERHYASIQKEIGEIERGEWDKRILEENISTNGHAKQHAKDNDLSGGVGQPHKAPEKSREQPKSPHQSPRPEGLAMNGANAKPSPPRPQEPSRLPGFPPPLSRRGSNGPHGPSPLQTPVQTSMDGRGQQAPGSHFQPPLQQGLHYSGPQNGQPGQYTWEPSFPPATMQGGHAYPFTGQHQQYPQYPPPHHHQEPFSSPRGVPPLPIRVPSSPIKQQPPPIVLPPPNGAPRQPGSPAMQLDALADAAGQQYRANVEAPMIQQARPSGSPVLPQGPIRGSPVMQHGIHGPPLAPGAHVPPQHGSVNSPVMQGPPHGFPYTPQQRPPSVNGSSQWSQQQPMPFPSPSQQHAAPPHQRLPFQPPPTLVPSQGKTYNSPYNPHQDNNRSQPLRPNFPQTPLFRPHQHKTGSGTIWTPTPTGATPARGAFDVSESPAIEPLSPILRHANLPEKKTPRKKTEKKPDTPKTMQSVEQPRREPKPKASRREAVRSRAGSVASSVLAGSRRSQSVMSHADELSLDNEALHRIKQEVATPVGVDESDHTTADEQARPAPGPSPRQSTKRKRALSNPIKAPSPAESKSSAPPTHVRWTRAFPNISKSALEAIAGHRSASTFSDPVKEKYAPGYKQIVLRAQDLKSIRTAITAGHRAATAAAPDDLPANVPTAWLEISEDLVPPRGIINYAQLEKELMRMFANAIMFNPDPARGLGRRWQGIGRDKGDVVGYEIDEDGVVKDTRAMFADVEKIVGSLRGAERRSEEIRESSLARAAVEDDDDADELAGDGDPPAGNTGIVKRRKKA
ncbi:hypothetical protein PZA11_005650 [Diplocarpon coronariae]|uniref:Bromo domain-containing protein n=1 Tax=Diplocarpon coronariae TaxID=2795749 RepID=A0A218Z8G6_9HELO|nr:hypothetical protein B2J93_9336 [Marssonina coronariae]